jgi:hypothetical protein
MFLLKKPYIAIPLVLIAVAFGCIKYNQETENGGSLSVASVSLPIIMDTNGGNLEVATLTVTEGFSKVASPNQIGPIDTGRTYSEIKCRIVYRYFIKLDKVWEIKLSNNEYNVVAENINPSLPVSIDTKSMLMHTTSGWLRWDKHENLQELVKSITPIIDERAKSAQYRQLVRESARNSVSEFVSRWLIKEKRITEKINVKFKDEI